jgi:organic hydroperoxide reductase OsmC/OhrA
LQTPEFGVRNAYEITYSTNEDPSMAKLGEDLIGTSGVAPFFKVANAEAVSIDAPENRNGDALRTWVRSLSGFQKEALVRSAKTGDTWRLVSDEGPYLNGHDAAPCPLAFLSTGMVASYMNEIIALAKIQGVEIRKLRLNQDNYYTMKGSMPRRTMVGGAEPVELRVEIDCDLEDGPLNTFLMNAVHASPLNGLMRGQLESLFKLAKNGAVLPTAKVAELDAPLFPDPGNHFATAQPIDASDLTLMSPVGPTPKKDVVMGTASAAGSLAAEQDRRLNIGAIAELREDGLKDLQQMQYSPWGTSFRFLSSEDGRAPDANTLISAGIAFCFMTQFGRFVSMLKLDLPDYRIVQDTHFSLGGASGGTGKAGSADPIETHVYLQTNESDQTAQEMLDISEQTCFLHAFCRTDLKTKLKVVRT